MLDLADGRQDNSRLACQIHASAALDGLVVRMPETQH
jgi:2Fe-2S ferredoxin